MSCNYFDRQVLRPTLKNDEIVNFSTTTKSSFKSKSSFPGRENPYRKLCSDECFQNFNIPDTDVLCVELVTDRTTRLS